MIPVDISTEHRVVTPLDTSRGQLRDNTLGHVEAEAV